MKRNMTILMLALGAGSLVACASSTPPDELVEARAAYQRAANGPAAAHAPAQLSTAQKALARAEEEFADDGADRDTKDHAYVAVRLSQLAEARAQSVLAQNARSQSQRQLEIAQAEYQRKVEEELGSAKRELTEDERRRAEALAALDQIGEVKIEKRGLVVNITAGVMFPTGKSTLLPEAKERLGALAEAVMKMPKAEKIVVEGHADSQGSEKFNQQLSEARAANVKAFLMAQGVPGERLESEGMGESDPVADNNTKEGRAENRRVEIVIERAG